MPKAEHIDLSGVRVSDHDGRLMAHSFNISICDSCDSAHFDLQADDDKTVFATATIGPEAFRHLAAWFTQAANSYEHRSGKKGTS